MQREARKKMNAEGDAAMDRLKALRQGNGADPAAQAAAQQAAQQAAAAQQVAAAQQNVATQQAVTGQPATPTKPTMPGKRPFRTASEVRAAAGITSPGITPGGGRQSLNDAIPAKYKRWRKPGSNTTNNNAKS